MSFAAVTVGTTVGNSAAPPVFGAVIDLSGFVVAFAALVGLAVVGLALTAVVGVVLRE